MSASHPRERLDQAHQLRRRGGGRVASGMTVRFAAGFDAVVPFTKREGISVWNDASTWDRPPALLTNLTYSDAPTPLLAAFVTGVTALERVAPVREARPDV